MLGLLYDVHGNLPALDAVLADAEDAGVDRWLLGGDYALFGAWPAESVARLRELDGVWIRGNVDRWTRDAGDAPVPVQGAIERCRELLGEAVVGELAALAADHRDGETLYCHGSPLSDVRSFSSEPDPEEDAELLEPTPEGVRRVVFGHTHLAFKRQAGEAIELVNPGSVGIPCDGDHRASYAVVAQDGSVTHRRVAYDYAASAAAVREVLGEDGEVPARRIEQARFDVE